MLRKHYLDIEMYFLSYLLWKDKSIIEDEKFSSPENQKIFTRILFYCSNQINRVCKALNLDNETKEKIWDFFKDIIQEKRYIFY